MEWTTIESDPGVFTELVSAIGVSDVSFEEVYALDVAELTRIEPIYGLIFLFKYTSESPDEHPATAQQDVSDVFFARQIIQNACATQAVLSVLLNAREDVQLGETLNNFLDFTAEFDADMKGVALSNSDIIRDAHNSFARPEPIMLQSRPAREDDDVFHFVGFVPRGGHVFELDGLRAGPINHGAFENGAWLQVAISAIQSKIAKYSSNEIKFNLMAVTKDRAAVLRERLVKLHEAGLDASSSAEVLDAESLLEIEESRRQRWRDENIRRKHNYIPFMFQLLKEMATKQQLLPALSAAKDSRNS